ncbi:hypothetical protein H0264_18360 [Nocardia huaxiensis]|uniref:Glycine zipper domain-containing protein n=1 Tax=Nocardia huaxiensis TaxID=2755382 RepID=A0A7D7A1W8_9NOCA|nr:hypothetical protein [Nocardia huaxiensis]QLY33929.1 hypothetical protein H0264_18360 [Nocardia huaxiensis]
MSVSRALTVLSVLPALFVAGQGIAAAAPENLEPEQARDPHVLRLGTDTVPLPEFVDTRTRETAQAAIDQAARQISDAYDSVGFSESPADRRIATTVAGGAIGLYVGKAIVTFPIAVAGCGVGMVVGGIAGGIAGGVPSVGVGAPLGAAIGGLAGCVIGGVAATVPAEVVGMTGGAVIGGAIGNALGAGTDEPQPDSNPAPVAQPNLAPVAQPDPPLLDAVAAVHPEAEAAVTSLRGAIAAVPPLDPAAFGPFADSANALLSAVRAAV